MPKRYMDQFHDRDFPKATTVASRWTARFMARREAEGICRCGGCGKPVYKSGRCKRHWKKNLVGQRRRDRLRLRKIYKARGFPPRPYGVPKVKRDPYAKSRDSIARSWAT